MSILKNKSTQKNSLLKTIFCSVLGSGILYAVASAVLAALMVNGNFNGSISDAFAIVALCIGGFFCSWISVKMLQHGVLICAVAGFSLYGLIPLTIGVTFGSLELSYHLLIRMILVFICSFSGGIIGTQKLIGKRKVG